MASSVYLKNRKIYATDSARPQAMLWAENSGKLEDGFYLPYGYEVGTDASVLTPTTQDTLDAFLILSDHGRGDISFKPTRIESRKRMINGRMRSYHIADKLTVTISWDKLPSRAFSNFANFDAGTGNANPVALNANYPATEYTVDGGAGGVEMLDWYENHTGSFWVYLSYDKYKNFIDDGDRFKNLPKYSQVIEMFISDFSYTVTKRGQNNHDLWNITVTLEEV